MVSLLKGGLLKGGYTGTASLLKGGYTGTVSLLKGA